MSHIFRPKGDKYKHKSEIVSYDSGKDQTIKRKKEEAEEVTPAKKVKKEEIKNEPGLDGSLNLPESAEKPKKVQTYHFIRLKYHWNLVDNSFVQIVY